MGTDAETIGGPYISVGKCSAQDATMSRKLLSAQRSLLERDTIGDCHLCGIGTHLALLCTVLPPSKILVPPGPPAASLASLWLSRATARPSS